MEAISWKASLALSIGSQTVISFLHMVNCALSLTRAVKLISWTWSRMSIASTFLARTSFKQLRHLQTSNSHQAKAKLRASEVRNNARNSKYKRLKTKPRKSQYQTRWSMIVAPPKPFCTSSKSPKQCHQCRPSSNSHKQNPTFPLTNPSTN